MTQVDVIVNTTSKDLNLNAGGVSASILRAAGPTIQQECQQVTIPVFVIEST